MARTKVFISFSGQLSKAIAEILHAWLRRIIQAVEPFVSSDIAKGDAWFLRLFQELNQSNAGIICVTRENVSSGWLLFEAGALARHVDRSRVCTLLINLTEWELQPPLSGFQATTLEKQDILRLVKTINNVTETMLNERLLEEVFEKYWGDLEADIRRALADSGAARDRDGIQNLAEELIIPLICRELRLENLSWVFDQLNEAKQHGVAGAETELGFMEAALARLTGKRKAGRSLKLISQSRNQHRRRALLELIILKFTERCRLSDAGIDFSAAESTPESRSLEAMLALWLLREQRDSEARVHFERLDPASITESPFDYYLAIPFGILCLAFGHGELAEKYLDLTRKSMPFPHDGYPFVSLTRPIEKAFVNACVGQGDPVHHIHDDHIRQVKGHAWAVVQNIDVLCKSGTATSELVSLSRTWKHPFDRNTLLMRLTKLREKLVAVCGDHRFYS